LQGTNWRASRKAALVTLMLLKEPLARLSQPGTHSHRTPVLAISTLSRDRYKNIPVGWLSLRQLIMENQFGRVATSTFRWWPGTSIITQGGRSSCRRSFPAIRHAELSDK